MNKAPSLYSKFPNDSTKILSGNGDYIPNVFGYGNSFPTNPVLNDRFFRTDLGWLCYWDGARWLTSHEYSLVYYQQTGLTTAATTALMPLPDDFDIYFTRCTSKSFVATTNNNSNYWTASLSLRTLAFAGSPVQIISQFTTASDTAATFADHSSAANATYSRSTYAWVTQRVDITAGAPGAITVGWNVRYRIVVT